MENHRPQLKNSKIDDRGSGNILFCEPGVILEDSTITFWGNKSLVYLGAGTVRANIHVFNDCTVYIGKSNFFNPDKPIPCIRAGEQSSIIIGSDCPISTNLLIESNDGHLLVDLEDGKRVNYPKNIYIGDHVWIGRNVTILKGTHISTGCTIGSSAVLSGKETGACEIWAGNSARCIKKNHTYAHAPKGTNYFNKAETRSNDTLGCVPSYKLWNSINAFNFNEKEVITTEVLDDVLSKDIQERLEFLQKLPMTNGRFIWKK